MKSKKSRKLRAGEKAPEKMNFAKSIIGFALAVTKKKEKGDELAGHHQSVRKTRERFEKRLYQRFLAEKAEAEQAVQRQCEELLRRYQEKMR